MTYPDLGAASGGVVVVVHDDVHREVEGDDDPLLLGQLCIHEASVSDRALSWAGLWRLLTTEVSPSSWVKHKTAVAAWWKTCRNSEDQLARRDTGLQRIHSAK
jgi:hypothetical protein